MNKNHTVTLKSNPENLTRQPLDEILRLGAQELLAQALDVEVNLHLERYQNMIDEQTRRLVVRNGYHVARKIMTGAGPVEVKVPRVDDRALRDEPRFVSQLVPPYLRKTKNMEELLPVLYLKGISTGDFQEALEHILGKNAVGLSAQTICRLKEIWQKEYEAWAKRDLSSVEYVYWWADGIHFNVRLGDDKRMCLLVIIGVRREKDMLENIHIAPTKMDANAAFDMFIEEFDAKYPKAVDCLRNHRERLMAFYNYPAEHWRHIRTTNVIESPFAAVRLRTNKTKGCGTRMATLTMVFKLLGSAQKRWQRIHGYAKAEDIWQGIKYQDGIRVAEILNGKITLSEALELASV